MPRTSLAQARIHEFSMLILHVTRACEEDAAGCIEKRHKDIYTCDVIGQVYTLIAVEREVGLIE